MYTVFGSGILTAIPSGSNPTPVPFAAIQDVSLSLKFQKKKLYGSSQFPIAVARGEGEITWKAKSAYFSASALNAILTGSTSSTGNIQGVAGEAAAVPSGSGYTITTTQHTTFATDLGVLDVVAGKPMTCVAAGAEAAGKYSVASTGIYTFAAADASKAVAITYTYTVAATGSTVNYDNQQMGSGSTMGLILFNTNPSNGKPVGIKLYATIIEGLDLAFKNNDFTLMDISGEAFADNAGNVLDAWSAD